MKNQQQIALDRIKKVSMSLSADKVKQAIEEWTRQGGNVGDNPIIECGYPLFHYLIIFGRRDVEFIKYLLSKGADITGVDERGSNMLHIAAALGNTEMIEYCLSLEIFDINGVNYKGCTALRFASEGSYLKVGQYLIEHGADVKMVESSGLLGLIADNRCLDMMQYLATLDFDLKKLCITSFIPDNQYIELTQSLARMQESAHSSTLSGESSDLDPTDF